MTAPSHDHGGQSPGQRRREWTIRSLLLVVVALGAVGLLTELLLLEHWIATPQLTPLVTLALVLGATATVARRPDRRTVRVFRLVMAWAVVAGLTGIGFHMRDNLAFEREVTPEAPTSSLAWHALHGATPLLAPGSLVQLGLIGLVFTYGHPALKGPGSSSTASDPSHSDPSH